MNRNNLLMSTVLATFMLLNTACEDSNNDEKKDKAYTFTALESPYLICAGRNPGGIGFDFTYDNAKAGAYNIDDTTAAANLNYDIKIRTIKGEKPDGSLGGSPFIVLSSTAKAVNYSAMDSSCTGITEFNKLTASKTKPYTLNSDNASFNVSSLQTGETGQPLMSALNKEYKKLAIGATWKTSANNNVEEDELIWIVETTEGDLVKLIVTDFPAAGAPTKTGYIAITWDYLK